MGDQLASLEASLLASDKQAGSLQQELASLGNAGPNPPAMKINGRVLNGASTGNLPKGHFYTLTDRAAAAEASQADLAAAEGEGGDSSPQQNQTVPTGSQDPAETEQLTESVSPVSASAASTASAAQDEGQDPDNGQRDSNGNGGSSDATQPGARRRFCFLFFFVMSSVAFCEIALAGSGCYIKLSSWDTYCCQHVHDCVKS